MFNKFNKNWINTKMSIYCAIYYKDFGKVKYYVDILDVEISDDIILFAEKHFDLFIFNYLITRKCN